MRVSDLTELIEMSNKVEEFLLEYASGMYGKYGKFIDITEEIVKTFMQVSSKEAMSEVFSYLEFKDEMIADKKGAADLEDFIDYTIRESRGEFN